MTRPSYTCSKCERTSYHPMDLKHRYCGACYKFEDEEPHNGTDRPDDTYCTRCDIYGHAENSPACEFYFKRWETTDADDN